MVNILFANILMIQGFRASAVIVYTWLSQNNPVSAPEGVYTVQQKVDEMSVIQYRKWCEVMFL